MADTTTTNYGFTKPEVGASQDSWGTKLNGNWDDVDADLKDLEDTKAEKATTISAGTGLTGGGDLSANRTVTLADTAVTPGTYSPANVTVDQQGRITAASTATVNNANWSGAQLAVINGGTGAASAAAALQNFGLTATAAELNYCDGVTGNIQTQLNAKAALASPALTGTPTTPTASYGTNTTQIASTAFVQAALQAVFPVGSIYINASSTTNPATLFGFGTWVAFGDGRVMVGQDTGDSSFDAMGETGGSKNAIVVSHTHSVTVTDPGHKHVFGSDDQVGTYGGYTKVGGFGYDASSQSSGDGRHLLTKDTSITDNPQTTGITASANSTGSSGANANLQPYIVVKMWKRTA